MMPSEMPQVNIEPSATSVSQTQISERINVMPSNDELSEKLIDQKLATVEARTETRFVELSGKLDRVADSISSLTTAVSTVRSEVEEENKLTRWTIIGLVIAGIGALWLTQSNMLASFMAGIALHEAKQEISAPMAPPGTPNVQKPSNTR